MRAIKGPVYLGVLVILGLAPYYVSSYNLSLLGRFLALAILAIGLVLVWGWGGILSLGQGVFFGMGAYALAIHMKLVGLNRGDLPDFMQWSGIDHLPWWWHPFHSASFSLAAVILVPTLAAAGLAWLVFHRRVGGVYFALITQALALAFATLLVSEQPYTGGFNGLTNFSSLLGFTLTDPKVQRGLYWVTLAVLVLAFALSAWVLDTNFGKLLLAIRDGENRVRFLGYNPVPYKVAVFALGGALAGVAGALFTLHLGVISPAMVGVVPSIEMVVWVAVGGRESLIGAVAGTLLVNFGKDWVSSAMPNAWLFAIGFLFIIVVTVMPNGLSGLASLRPWRGMRAGIPAKPFLIGKQEAVALPQTSEKL
ncbi:MAG: urea ABC transporter permease subunit UrtC [Terriglobia bacterium]